MPVLHATALLTPDRDVRPATVSVDLLGNVVATGVGAEGAAMDGVLVPGFVDVQVNGARGHTLSDCTEEAFEGVRAALTASGTTSWCPTLPTAAPAVYPRFLDAAALAQQRPGPRVLGVHLEGPFLSARRRGAHDESLLRAPDADWLESVLDHVPGLVRVVTLAPELPGAIDLVRLCVARGVTVSLGHSDATADQTLAAVDAGATMLTHLFNAMRPIGHRDPGVAGAAICHPGVRVGVICDGRHVDGALVSFFARALGPMRAAAVSDAVGNPVDGPVLRGGFELLDGGLANLVAWGLPFSDALRMVTRTPAEAVCSGAGRLDPGDRADAVLLRDGRVRAVWMGGERVHVAADGR